MTFLSQLLNGSNCFRLFTLVFFAALPIAASQAVNQPDSGLQLQAQVGTASGNNPTIDWRITPGATVESTVIPTPPEHVIPPPDVMLILDGSGSMWAPVSKTSREPRKITVAKKTINQLLDDWNEDIELGLTLYGHRRDRNLRDCTDIEVAVAPGQNTVSEIRAGVNALNPKSMTPLASSLRLAAETLNYTEQRAAVILVSDGIESCRMDPCQTAKELRAQGHEFVTHVIGFALDQKHVKNLRCIADETEGVYASANNPDELLQALRNAAAKAQRWGPERFQVRMGPNSPPLTDYELDWRIFPKWKTPDAAVSKRGTGFNLEMDPGTYTVQVSTGSVAREVEIYVSPRDVQSHMITLNVGDLRVKANLDNPADGSKINWNLSPEQAGLRGWQAQGGEFRTLPAAGQYRLEANLGDQHVSSPTTIKVAEVTSSSTDLRLSSVTTIAMEADPGPMVPANWKLTRINGSNTDYRKAKGKSVEWEIPQGRYRVTAEYAGVSTSQDFQLGPAENISRKLLLNIGRLNALALHSDQAALAKINWSITPLDSEANNNNEVITAVGGSVEQSLPAGRYEVVAQLKNSRVSEQVNIPAGGSRDLTLAFNGQLRLSAYDAEGGRPETVNWKIASLNGNAQSRTASAQSDWASELPAGDYRITVEHRLRSISRDINIKAGSQVSEAFYIDIGRLLAEARLYPGGPKVDGDWALQPAADSAEIIDKRQGDTFTQQALAGEYRLSFSHPLGERTDQITLKPSTVTRHEISLDTGELKLTAQHANPAMQSQARWSIQVEGIEGETKAAGEQHKQRLVAGRYQITASINEDSLTRTVVVPNGGLATEHFDFTGKVNLNALNAPNGKAIEVDWVIQPQGSGVPPTPLVAGAEAQSSSGWSGKLASGVYQIQARHPLRTISREIHVKPQAEQTETFILDLGYLEADARLYPSGPFAEGNWSLSPTGKTSALAEPSNSRGDSLILERPAGDYLLRFEHPLGQVEQAITITSNETQTASLSLNTGQLAVVIRRSENGELLAAPWALSDQQDKLLMEGIGQLNATRLPAGQYQLSASHAGIKRVQNISLAAGETKQLDFSLGLGWLHLFAKNAGAQAKDLNWSITGQGQTLSSPSINGVEEKLELAAGKYTVKLSIGAYASQREIEVSAGETERLAFDLTGTLQAKAYRAEQGSELAATWRLRPINAQNQAGAVQAQSEGNSAEFTVAPGQYFLSANHAFGKNEQRITLQPGAVEQVDIIANVGKLALSAERTEGGKAIAVAWTVQERLADGSLGDTVASSQSAEYSKELNAGQYLIRAKHPRVDLEQLVDIQPGKTTTLKHNLALGELRTVARLRPDGEPVIANWMIRALDGKAKGRVQHAFGAKPNFEVSAGQYLVTVQHGDAKHNATTTVFAGETVQALVDLSGEVSLSALLAPGEQAVSVEWLISPLGGNGEQTDTQWRFGPDVELALPPGQYSVSAEHPQAIRDLTLDVMPGQRSEFSISMDLGTLKLSADQASSAAENKLTSVRWRVYKAAEAADTASFGNVKRPEPIFDSISEKAELMLPQGNYRVTALHDAGLFEEGINVVAGQVKTLNVDLNLGRLSGSINNAADDAGPLRWLITPLGNDNGQLSIEGKPKLQTFLTTTSGLNGLPLPAGKWRIRVWQGARSGSSDITVLPGKTVPVAISLGE